MEIGCSDRGQLVMATMMVNVVCTNGRRRWGGGGGLKGARAGRVGWGGGGSMKKAVTGNPSFFSRTKCGHG